MLTGTTFQSAAGRYVLVVDDDAAVRRLFTTALRRNGAEVGEATDGISALKMVCGRMPDVIVTDVTMPHLDGIEFIRRLRRNPRANAVPIIVVSGHAACDRIAAEAHEAGCDALLAKPCTLEALVTVVHRKAANGRAGSIGRA